MDLLSLAIGIGLAVSLVLSELFGLAAGGMVVPGYVALHLSQPLNVAITLAAGFATFAIVHALSTFVIIYGKRRTVLMILVGYLLGASLRTFVAHPPAALPSLDLAVIGYVIPGLIAIWIDRQGLLETFSALLTASVIVRLTLILCVPAELHS